MYKRGIERRTEQYRRTKKELEKESLKGQLHGPTKIFKGLKMTFRKNVEKKLYHVNQHQKYYKLCFDNFSLRQPFFDRAPDRGQFHLSDAPSDQDKLLLYIDARFHPSSSKMI